jgi:glucose-1-phosphate adenylyltransferase
VQVEESLIAEGCFVKNSTIVRSVLGLGTRVGSGCIIEDSYIMGAKEEYCRTIEYTIDESDDESTCIADPDIIGIGKGSILRNCVVDKNASIGEGCYLINKDNIQEGGSEAQGYYIRSGVINVLKDAMIPDGTVI